MTWITLWNHAVSNTPKIHQFCITYRCGAGSAGRAVGQNDYCKTMYSHLLWKTIKQAKYAAQKVRRWMQATSTEYLCVECWTMWWHPLWIDLPIFLLYFYFYNQTKYDKARVCNNRRDKFMTSILIDLTLQFNLRFPIPFKLQYITKSHVKTQSLLPKKQGQSG